MSEDVTLREQEVLIDCMTTLLAKMEPQQVQDMMRGDGSIEKLLRDSFRFGAGLMPSFAKWIEENTDEAANLFDLWERGGVSCLASIHVEVALAAERKGLTVNKHRELRLAAANAESARLRREAEERGDL